MIAVASRNPTLSAQRGFSSSSSCCSLKNVVAVFLVLALVCLFLDPTIAQQQHQQAERQCTAATALDDDDDDVCSSSADFENPTTTSQKNGKNKMDHHGKNDVRTTNVENAAASSQRCGLYMAESSIPNAGWGIFTGKALQEKDYFNPRDVVIDVYDIRQHIQQSREAAAGAYGSSIPFGSKSKRAKNKEKNNEVNGDDEDDDDEREVLPDWLFQHYEWDGFEVKSQYNADFVRSILPGFGML
jgi:hypothetical protein